MPRIARLVAVDYPHHITQRGNYQQKTFKDKSDFIQYLKWFEEYHKKYLLSVLSYCLMPNHVHSIVIPCREYSLAKTFNTTHMRYSQFFNRKNNLRGHLWQGRFYSCVLDEKHLYASIRYVERNPVEAGLVRKPWEWKWSSALSHLRGIKRKDINGITLADINEFIQVENWEEYLGEENNKNIVEKIEKHTLTGRPLGNTEFLKNLEHIYKRKLIAMPVGRPRKDS